MTNPKQSYKLIVSRSKINFCNHSRSRIVSGEGYPRRARLKLLGRARVVELTDAPELAAALTDQNYGAKVERGLIIDVEAFDWNCISRPASPWPRSNRQSPH
jgi:hypothetical protein